MQKPTLLGIQDLEDAAPSHLIEEAERLTSKYENYLAGKSDGGKRKAGIHASEISKCYRMAVYTMRGEEKRKQEEDPQDSARWQRTFDQGHAIHQMIQQHFRSMADNSGRSLRFEDEVPLHPNRQPLAAKWNIHSSCDGIFTFQKRDPETWDMQPYIRMGLEIKSANANQFGSLREPKPEHIEQAHVYMAVLDLPIMWLLYFNKDNQNITPASSPWLLSFDRKLWERLERRFAGWNKHLEEGTLPDAMPGSHCGFCQYAWTCKPPGRYKSWSQATKIPLPRSAGFRKLN